MWWSEIMRKENKTMETDEIDLLKLASYYLQRWWIILLCGLVAGAVALVCTLTLITPKYQANVSIYVNNSRGEQSTDYVTSSNLDASQKLVNTYINLAQSDLVMEKVLQELNGIYTVKELREMFSASQVDKTEIFRIYITCPDPNEAAQIANIMGRVVPEMIPELVTGSSAWVIDYAKVPEQRHSPSYSKNTVIGVLGGCVLAMAYMTLMFLLDVRIKNEEDLTSIFDLPILGQIPDIDAVDKINRKLYGYGPENAAAAKGGKKG